MNPCRNCDAPTEGDVCPATNNCTECGRHLEGINYPYVCGPCLRRPWQEKVDDKYDEPWFQLPTPQAAWDACPDGRKLLWVLGRRSVNTSLACVRLTAQVTDGLDPNIVDYLSKLWMLIDGKPAPGVLKLSREVDERWPDDPGLEGRFPTAAENRDWLAARLVSDAHAVQSGMHRRGHYAAYYAHQLGVDDGQAARVVRELFPEERFTK
jgi:hypothetical protein